MARFPKPALTSRTLVLAYAVTVALLVGFLAAPSLVAGTDHTHDHDHDHAHSHDDDASAGVPLVPASASYWIPPVEDDMLGALNEHVPGILTEVSDLTGITFTPAPSRAEAFLVIEWGQTSRENNHSGVILGSERTITDEVTGEYLSSLITINVNKIAGNMYFDEFRRGSDRTHIKTLLRHEIGHTLGLGHEDSTDELMVATITDYTGPDAFSPNAASQLRELYSS